jgi:TonB family protein
MPFEPPAMLMATDQHGTAELHVWLSDKTGSPDKVELVQPSGSEIVDGAALETTKQTKFQPETRACSMVAGEYFYEFEY